MAEVERVAFLGLGIMGWPMAANLVGAGFHVTVWNRTQERAEAFAQEHGARAAGTPAGAAAGAQLVITMVPDAPQVEEGLFGPDGAGLSGLGGLLGGGQGGNNAPGGSGGQDGGANDQPGLLGEAIGSLLQQGLGGGQSGSRPRGVSPPSAPTEAAPSAPPPPPPDDKAGQPDSQPMNGILRQLFKR
jgi:hypothetical protein